MPTGYTAGILDGTTNTFQDFAKLCTRAFGATMHLRDESLDTEYKPQKPGKYHFEKIEEANKLMQKANSLTDEQLISERKIELKASIELAKKAIEKETANKEKLEAMLQEAKDFIPPTSEHQGIKDFMVNQIEETIKFDCDSTYYSELLESSKKELENLDAWSIRSAMIGKAQKDLDYNRTELNKEVARCNNSNQWYAEFLKAISSKAI